MSISTPTLLKAAESFPYLELLIDKPSIKHHRFSFFFEYLLRYETIIEIDLAMEPWSLSWFVKDRGQTNLVLLSP
jgi:hypothetical protein